MLLKIIACLLLFKIHSYTSVFIVLYCYIAILQPLKITPTTFTNFITNATY